MNVTIFRKPLAAVLLVALGACSGAASAPSPASGLPAAPQARRPLAMHPHQGITSNIVGIGDSLTAGYQAGGFLGQLGVKNPLNPNPPFDIVPPGQESGWWADLYEQATGFNPAAMYDPGVSPLPLIRGPGLDNQVVSSATTVVGELKSGNACTDYNNFNADGFQLGKLPVVRLNASSRNVRDLAIPGITLHEALYMTHPITSTCESIPGTPGLLSEVVQDESNLFYPVLGGFANMGIPSNKFTMVNIAQRLQPSLVTVWLGANDVLKFMGSGGQFTGGDNTVSQVKTDLYWVIHNATADSTAGPGVAVANLPDVLLTPYFMNMALPPNQKACQIRQYFYCLLTEFGIPPGDATAAVRTISKTYGLTPPSGRCTPTSTTAPCGYVVLPGALAVVAEMVPSCPTKCKIPNLDPSGPGSGLGNHYITPAFAARVQALNNTVNEGIDEAAQQNGTALVDVRTIFQGIASGDPKNPYFQLAQVNPGVCCTEVFLGGLVSFDGLHPSNTGYALIAYAFIASLNAKYNLGIPEVPIDKIYSGKPPYKIADPYAPQVVGDLHPINDGRGHISIGYRRP